MAENVIKIKNLISVVIDNYYDKYHIIISFKFKD